MIELTLKELLNSNEAIQGLIVQNVDGKYAFDFADWTEETNKKLKILNKTYQKIIAKYAVDNIIPEDKKSSLNKELDEMLNTKVKIEEIPLPEEELKKMKLKTSWVIKLKSLNLIKKDIKEKKEK